MDNLSMRAIYYLNAATNDIRRGVDGVFEGTGMSDIQWIIMFETSKGMSTIGEIAERVARDPSTVSREIFRLEDRGLMRVTEKDPHLASTVTLTPKAENQLPALNSAAGSVAEQATCGLTNDELASLVSMLQRIVRNLS